MLRFKYITLIFYEGDILKFFLSFILFFLCFFTTPIVQASNDEAGDIYDLPQLVAVQNRKYFLKNGLTFHADFLPSDSITRGFNLGLSLTHNLNDFIAWEIANLNYTFSMDTNLSENLKKDFDKTLKHPLYFNFFKYYITTSLIYTPIYSKNLLFNKALVWSDINFLVGAGVGKLSHSGFKPIFNVGFYLRYFTSPKTSIKIDFREIIFKNSDRKVSLGLKAIMVISIGLDIQLGNSSKPTSPLLSEAL